MSQFVIKTDDKRIEFDSGMVRSPSADRVDYTLIRSGPMFHRWAVHLTNGAKHYGRDNWQKAQGLDELRRFQESAARHFEQWLRMERDEDHAAAIFFNVNGVEYVWEKMNASGNEK